MYRSRIRASQSAATSGFTIVELVVVIALLGILAAVALPRFLNLQDDAVRVTLTSFSGSLRTSANMAYSQAMVELKNSDASSTITMDGQNVELAYGYPTAFSGIRSAISAPGLGGYGRNNSNSQFDWVYQLIIDRNGRRGLEIAPGSVVGDAPAPTPKSTNCFVRYLEANATQPADVELFTAGC